MSENSTKGMCRIRRKTDKLLPKFKIWFGGFGYIYYVGCGDVNKVNTYVQIQTHRTVYVLRSFFVH